jgi:hypothetical protein
MENPYGNLPFSTWFLINESMLTHGIIFAAAAILLAKNIVPYLVITCKAYNVFMLLLSSTTEILAVTDELKGISCG